MKRIIAFVLAVALALAGMAIPVSAQVVPSYATAVNSLLAKMAVLSSGYTNGYPYYAIGQNYDSNIYWAVYSKDPVIKVGTEVYAHCFKSMVHTPDSSYKGTVTQFAWTSTAWGRMLDVTIKTSPVATGTAGLLHYFPLESTATFDLTVPAQYQDGFLWYTSAMADTSALSALVTLAKSKKQADYTDDSWKNLQAVIAEADALLKNSYPLQPATDEMYERLQAALDALETRPPPVDVSALESLIEQAEAIADEGYAADSWDALQSAIQSAKTMLAGSPSQAQINFVTDMLQSAIYGLRLASPLDPDTSQPETSTPGTNPPGPGTGKYPLAPSEYRYLADGIPLDDMLPMQDAILENMGFARSNGFILFGILIAIFLIPRIINSIVSFQSEARFINLNQPGPNSSYEYDEESGGIFKKRRPRNDKGAKL